jgi:uncharacterized protein with HEPN domain
MPKRDYIFYIDDIIEAIGKIEKYIKELTFDEFDRDSKVVDAVIRNFEIIGEASKNMPTEVKKRYSDIPWKIMAGMRNKLIHEYFGINKKVLWKTIKEDLAGVKPLIAKARKETKEESLF